MKRKTDEKMIVLTGLDGEGVPDDENPEWTREDFKRAKRFHDLPKELQAGLLSLKKRGRPKKDNPKKQISFRLDAAIVDHLKQDVPGYNRRIEALIGKAMEEGRL